MRLPADLARVLEAAPSLRLVGSVDELLALATGGPDIDSMQVSYRLPDGNEVVEAEVARVRNGISVNYIEPYMRRRDPDCLVIGDSGPTDKPRYAERFGHEFAGVRQATLDWMASQDLAAFCFRTGFADLGADAVAVVPANAAFFGLGLAMLQGIIPPDELPEDFKPTVFLLVAPPFRHTHFAGKQVVVHNRVPGRHEIFSYNLYPGPSAKKGVYGTLIRKGAKEGWVAAHCSAVRVITPYDNVVTFMHEGASGGGKSEMLEQPHRLPDGRLLKGKNLVTGEERFLEIPRTCELEPVCDDMAMCHPTFQKRRRPAVDRRCRRRLVRAGGPHQGVRDRPRPGEADRRPRHSASVPERRCRAPQSGTHLGAHPGRAGAAVSQSPGHNPAPCDPRGGRRTRTRRCAQHRGADSPLHQGEADLRHHRAVSRAPAGSWPGSGGWWLPGATPIPASWMVKAWPAREWAATGPSPPRTWSTRPTCSSPSSRPPCAPATSWCPTNISGPGRPASCPSGWPATTWPGAASPAFVPGSSPLPAAPLLGYSLTGMRIEGVPIASQFLQVETQPEVGLEGYDAGAAQLREFFVRHLQAYLTPALDPKGRQIVECCLEGGSVDDYAALLPGLDTHVAGS